MCALGGLVSTPARANVWLFVRAPPHEQVHHKAGGGGSGGSGSYANQSLPTVGLVVAAVARRFEVAQQELLERQVGGPSVLVPLELSLCAAIVTGIVPMRRVRVVPVTKLRKQRPGSPPFSAHRAARAELPTPAPHRALTDRPADRRTGRPADRWTGGPCPQIGRGRSTSLAGRLSLSRACVMCHQLVTEPAPAGWIQSQLGTPSFQ
jgi:hypothetical protein